MVLLTYRLVHDDRSLLEYGEEFCVYQDSTEEITSLFIFPRLVSFPFFLPFPPYSWQSQQRFIYTKLIYLGRDLIPYYLQDVVSVGTLDLQERLGQDAMLGTWHYVCCISIACKRCSSCLRECYNIV